MAISLDVNDISSALGTVGFYVVFLGLISHTVQNNMFVSSALVAIILGIVTGPYVLGWNDPSSWISNESNFEILTYHVMRVTLGIQVLFIGIALPARYVRFELRSLTILLGPVMAFKWLVSALLIWAFVPQINYLEALVIAACVTPTDPVFANCIVKGRFAERMLSLEVRNIILAESAGNDGFGFPFLYLGLYLYTRLDGDHTVGHAVGEWFYNAILFQIVLGIIYGILVGYVARHSLRYAEKWSLIDHDHFTAYGLGLAFWILGTAGTLGLDDVMACFAAGNSFTWDDRYRLRTEEDPFQDVIDSVINAAVFIYIGAILDFSDWADGAVLSVWRVVVIGILVNLLSRLPIIIAIYKGIPTINSFKEAVFAGYFGPIAVAAVFYVQVSLMYLTEHGAYPHLQQVLRPTVYAIVLVSALAQGLMIPLAYGLPQLIKWTHHRNMERLAEKDRGSDRSETTSFGRTATATTPAPTAVQESLESGPAEV